MSTQEQLRRQQLALEASKEQLEIERKLAESRKEFGVATQRELDIKKEEVNLARVKLALAEKEGEEREKARQELENSIKSYEDFVRLQQQILDIQSSTQDVMGSIASKLGLVNTGAGKLAENILSANDKSKAFSASLNQAREFMSKFNFVATASVALVTAIANKTAETVLEVDKVRAGFVGVTADASDSMRMAERLTLSNLDLAISFDQMSKAQVELRTQFAQFGFLTDRVRESVTLQAAQLQKLGVDAGTTASIMNTLTMSFGQSAAEAAATQRQIIGLGQALKIPPAVIARDFAQALPHLAQFGDRAVQIFEELSVAARESGVSVSDLTSIFGDQFNTFEGAVTAAGRLNQALRSDVFSGMELLMADTAERQRMIKEGLRLSGLEFQNLERYEKLYIANAIGIRDVAQAAAILGDTQADVAMRIGDTSFSMAEMEDMAKRATATVDKMKFIFMQLAVAVSPLVDMFAGLIQGLLNVTAPIRANVTPVGDTSMPGGATQIVSGGQVFQPSSNDTVVAAQEGGILARELKEIKNAIKGMGAGRMGGNPTFVLRVDGFARELKPSVIKIIDDHGNGYT